MFDQFKCVASWANVKLNNKLGQRGAEMVEYAIVLACIVAVGVVIYGTNDNPADNTLNGVLTKMWTSIRDQAVSGTTKK